MERHPRSSPAAVEITLSALANRDLQRCEDGRDRLPRICRFHVAGTSRTRALPAMDGAHGQLCTCHTTQSRVLTRGKQREPRAHLSVWKGVHLFTALAAHWLGGRMRVARSSWAKFVAVYLAFFIATPDLVYARF